MHFILSISYLPSLPSTDNCFKSIDELKTQLPCTGRARCSARA